MTIGGLREGELWTQRPAHSDMPRGHEGQGQGYAA